MSVSKWRYTSTCDGQPCPGDCDMCDRETDEFGKWIPVTERLPKDDTLMLVNYIDQRENAADIWIGWHEMENVWYIDGEAHSREFNNEVIAWMPMPEPYQGENDD